MITCILKQKLPKKVLGTYFRLYPQWWHGIVVVGLEMVVVVVGVVVVRLGKNHFFVNSEILGIKICRKKRVNYDKFEIATKHVNQIFKPHA